MTNREMMIEKLKWEQWDRRELFKPFEPNPIERKKSELEQLSDEELTSLLLSRKNDE